MSKEISGDIHKERFSQKISAYVPSFRVGAVVCALLLGVLVTLRYFYNQAYLNSITPRDCQFGLEVGGSKRDFTYFQSSAQSGDPLGEFCLGILYQEGSHGAIQSDSMARHWHKSAYENGVSVAKPHLCDSRIYSDWTNDQENKRLTEICCPATCICPWEKSRFGFTTGTTCS